MRRGIELSRQTLSSALLCAAARCQRVYELMCDDLRQSSYIGIDETPCQVLGEEGRKNTTKSYMWVFRGGGSGSPIVLYRYAPTRSAAAAGEVVQGYRGVIQNLFERLPLAESNDAIRTLLPYLSRFKQMKRNALIN